MILRFWIIWVISRWVELNKRFVYKYSKLWVILFVKSQWLCNSWSTEKLRRGSNSIKTKSWDYCNLESSSCLVTKFASFGIWYLILLVFITQLIVHIKYLLYYFKGVSYQLMSRHISSSVRTRVYVIRCTCFSTIQSILLICAWVHLSYNMLFKSIPVH